MAQDLGTMTIEEIEAELKEQEASRYNPSRYVQLCDYLGVEPNLEDFYYDSSWIENDYFWDLANSYLEEIKRKEERKIYLKFLKTVHERHISDRSFETDLDKKIELLEESFPEEYGPDGNSPVRFLGHRRDLGCVFRCIKNEAIKRKNEVLPAVDLITRLFVDLEGMKKRQ
jgi:hypothetical protein